MTMTIREREALQSFVDNPRATASLCLVVAVLAKVALKQEQIRMAQAAPGTLAIAKCYRCHADLFAGDDFETNENGVSGCRRVMLHHEGAPCFRRRNDSTS